ncbi:MAG: hypothetical protein IKL68_03575, partial [Clostridia bacterium]|nr:hypothetical protein [Clostridia bacterium]
AKASCSVTVTGTVTSLPGLVSLITAANYGDTVDYTVTVDGTTYSDWQIYYHNEEHVYLIAKEKIENRALDKGTTVASLTSDELALYEKFRVGYDEKNTLADNINGEISYACQAVAQLIKDYANFANKTTYGTNVVGAIGGPTIELFAAGWNEKGYLPALTITIDDYGYLVNNDSNGLQGMYIDDFYIKNEYSYVLASTDAYSAGLASDQRERVLAVSNTDYELGGGGMLWGVGYTGKLGIRPVVCLKASIPATVGTTTDFSLVK